MRLPRRPANSWSNRRRRKLLGASCAGRGIELVDLGPYEPRFTGGYRAADEVLAADVTAAFAYNDLVALGVLSRLTARGVPVPGEPGSSGGLSIVGVDDVPMASMTNPPLTTVAIPVNALSRATAATMHALLDPGRARRLPAPPPPSWRPDSSSAAPPGPSEPGRPEDPVLPGGPTP